jgi:hypothetical protein
MKSYIFGILALLFLVTSGTTSFAGSMIKNGLSPEEIEGLVKMYEEEKLAYDIYSQMYSKWELPVFNNIMQSEQRHMEALLTLMKEYEIENECSDESGHFSDKETQLLYDSFIEKGRKSITDALFVGASIEDLDISDLDKLLAETQQSEIKMVYENLNKGSRNHLRTFIALLEARDAKYTPVYLNENRFLEIVSAEMERGGAKAHFARKGRSGNYCQGERTCKNGRQNNKCLKGKRTSCQQINENGERGRRKGKGRGRMSI